MIGLPTETNEDLSGIGELAQSVVNAYFALPRDKRAKGLNVTCSASSFVPKPFTPFQWAGQDTLDQIKEKQAYLRKVLNIRGVTFNWHDPEVSFMEACFSRGDRKMSDVLYEAWRLGCILDGWTEHFHYDLWLKALKIAVSIPPFMPTVNEKKRNFCPGTLLMPVSQNHSSCAKMKNPCRRKPLPIAGPAARAAALRALKGCAGYEDAGGV